MSLSAVLSTSTKTPAPAYQTPAFLDLLTRFLADGFRPGHPFHTLPYLPNNKPDADAQVLDEAICQECLTVGLHGYPFTALKAGQRVRRIIATCPGCHDAFEL
jgi:hypothetical protein